MIALQSIQLFMIAPALLAAGIVAFYGFRIFAEPKRKPSILDNVNKDDPKED